MRRVAVLGSVIALALGSAGCLTIPSGVFACAGDDDCPSGQMCGPGNTCITAGPPPAQCQLDTDCSVGEVCGRGGECTTVCAGPTGGRECDVYSCYSTSQTVRFNQLCDGVTNCTGDLVDLSDGVDELSCFTCSGDAGFVHTYTHCDAITDCGDGLDEATCFPCGDGTVTKLSYVCDDPSIPDCDLTQADEMSCTPFACGGGDSDISRALVCDGDVDCPALGTDEVGCVDFACNDGSGSISSAWVCDGWGDCDDGSDERPENCPFVCLSGERLPPSSRCNTVPECPGGEDEGGCP